MSGGASPNGGQQAGAMPMAPYVPPPRNGAAPTTGQLPPQSPVMGWAPQQHPTAGNIQGNPQYSSPYQPQLYGGFWNQLAQMMGGPNYYAQGPAARTNPWAPQQQQQSPYGYGAPLSYFNFLGGGW